MSPGSPEGPVDPRAQEVKGSLIGQIRWIQPEPVKYTWSPLYVFFVAHSELWLACLTTDQILH